MSTTDKSEAAIYAAYRAKYPKWTDVRIVELAENTLGGTFAVVASTTGSGRSNEELCYVDDAGLVRIFESTPELARFLQDKARVLQPARFVAGVEVDVFISHSSKDGQLVRALVKLIRASLNLPSSRIRCSSIDGYRLPAGTSIDAALRTEIHGSRALVAVITPASAASTYVLFELGARWGAQLPMLPLLASGASREQLQGPLSAINALDCDEPGQLHQFIEQLADSLHVPRERVAAYESSIREVADASRQSR